MANPTDQPADLHNDNGAIVTIGGILNGDRCFVTFPMATTGTVDKNKSLQDLCNGIGANITFSMFTAIVSSDFAFYFIQADGMVDGLIPGKMSLDPNFVTGTRGAGSSPANVTALGYWYMDARDNPGGTKRVREGKMYVPGVAAADLQGDIIADDLQTAIRSMAVTLQNGLNDAGDPPLTWYRVLSHPKNRAPGQTLIRTFECGARQYVCTQRRRVIPRA